MNEKVTAVVVTRNRVELLKRCLNALLTQKHQLFEIVIIDNASVDSTSDYIEQVKQNSIVPIVCRRMDENVGGAGGFYHGMRLAMNDNPDWMMLLDDDAEPMPDYVEKLMLAYAIHKDCGCFIGTEYVGATNQRAYGGRRRIVDAETLKEECVSEDEYSKDIFEIDTAVFVGFTVKCDVVQNEGYPDPKFFIYYDDTDYSLRIRRYTKIMCVPAARINHRTNFKQDVLCEGQKEWRRLYLFRNKLVIQKRYIVNSKCRRKSMSKAFVAEMVRTLRDSRRAGLGVMVKSLMHVIHAYNDACHENLGKIKYVSED